MTLPTPYYQSKDGSVVIYHGDALALLPELPRRSVDAVVTDPPYGMGYVGSPGTSNLKNLGPNAHYKGRRPLRTRETVVGDDLPFDPAPFLLWPCVFTGAQHFYDRLPPGGSLHSWDKRGEYKRLTFADADIIWCSRKINCQTYRCVWRGLCRHIEWDERIEHPTQKPITLMEWMIELVGGDSICDPFLGSGTTAVACIKTGRKCIGIEISEQYAAIAARRCEQAFAEQGLFRQEASTERSRLFALHRTIARGKHP